MRRTVRQDSVISGLYCENFRNSPEFIGSERQAWKFAWEEPHVLEPFPLGADLFEYVFRGRKPKWPRKFGPRDIEPDAACSTIKVTFAISN